MNLGCNQFPSRGKWINKTLLHSDNRILLRPKKKCREGNGNPLQYSCLENPMGRGAWLAAVHGVTKSQTRLSGFTFTFHFHALEKEMATYSSVFAWRIPWTEEPGRLQSMGSQTVRHTTNTHAHIHTVEKNLKKYMYVNHFAVYLKWCKSTILQLKNK